MQEVILTKSKDNSLGFIKINRPKHLNVLTLNCLKFIYETLVELKDDPKIEAIIIHSSGDKAFCAGGDIKYLREISLQERPKALEDAMRFFCYEYELDLLVHTYPKPIISFGQGYILGSGLGLFRGTSFRLATSSARLGMPEVLIGLYPDVGASWFLNKLPYKFGLFMALTGYMPTAYESLELGLVTNITTSKDFTNIVEQLTKDKEISFNSIKKLIDNNSVKCSANAGNVNTNFFRAVNDRINDTCLLSGIKSITEICNSLIKKDPINKIIYENCISNLEYASPLSSALIWEQLKRNKHSSLKECLASELILSVNSCLNSEFPEGVRAKLVDKDNSPNWKISLLEVSQEKNLNLINSFFIPPWRKDEIPNDLKEFELIK